MWLVLPTFLPSCLCKIGISSVDRRTRGFPSLSKICIPKISVCACGVRKYADPAQNTLDIQFTVRISLTDMHQHHI